MYSTYKLNKQGDNIEPWNSPFPIWNQSVLCLVPMIASWSAYRFLRKQVRWSGIPISWRIFQLWSTVKGFDVVSKAEVDFFFAFFRFFNDTADVGNWFSGSSAFSKSSLDIWTFTVHVLLKPYLENLLVCEMRANGDRKCEIKRHLLLGRKIMTNIYNILKSRDIALPITLHLVKVMIFPVVMYGCESWTIKKVSTKELMLLNCGVGKDSWESLGRQGDPISPT